MASVVINRLSKSFRAPTRQDVHAVRDISLEISDGELLVLVGPSGSGKTTLLRLIAGLEKPSAGQILLAGRDVTSLPPEERSLAMVFQEAALYPHLTVGENLAFGLKLRRYPQTEIKVRVQETAVLLGLSMLLDRLPAALSGGERQRVALGRAMILQPAVLLLDEPISNLDAALRVQMRREIAKLHRQSRATMIYVTHDQTEAMVLGDRIAVIKSGVLQQVGTPADVYERPANLFVAQFIGVPAMNRLNGKLREEKGQLVLEFGDGQDAVFGRVTFRVPDQTAREMAVRSGQSMIIGVRPEHIYLVRDDPHRVPAVSEPVGPQGGTPCHPAGEDLPSTTVGAGGKLILQAVVELVEDLGWERHYFVTANGCSVVARMCGDSKFRAGETVWMVLDLERVHWFEAESGNAASSTVWSNISKTSL